MPTMDDRLMELGITPIRGEFVPATAVEVDELERRLRRPLPVDYKDFLLRYGYARFDDLVSIPLRGDDQEAPMAVFFGGRESGESILREFDHYEEQLASGILPIARDPFGNLFLLEVGTTEPGLVWYATFDDKGIHAVPLTNSFRGFLDALTVEPDD